MKSMKQIFIVFFLVLFSAVLFSAGQAEADDGVVHLKFRQNDSPEEVAGLMEAVEEWNTANPGIQVDFETIPWSEALTQYVRESQAGTGPDVLQLAFVWTKDLATGGSLMKLDSLISSNPPGAGIDDFLGTDLGILEGSLYGIPWSVDTFAMAYRPDLLAKAGYSEFPRDWQEMLEASKVMTVDNNSDGRIDQYGFGFPAGSAPNGGMWFLVNYYLWSNGKSFVVENGGSYEIGVTQTDVADVMKYFNSYFEEGAAPKSLIAVNSWGDPELTGGLARGDFAVSFFPPSSFRAALASVREQGHEIVTAMIPEGAVTRSSHLGGRTLAINANTKHPEEAYRFLQYLVSKNVFTKYNQFPAQKSLLKELNFPAAEQGYADQLPYAQTFKTYIDSPAAVNSMWELINREFAAVYSGQKSIDQASADVIEALESFL